MNERIGRIIFVLIRPFLGLFLRDKPRTRALIIHSDKVLLLRNWIGSQRWTLPGGGLRSGEAPKDGLQRELNEELALNLNTNSFKQIMTTDQQEASVDFPVVIFEIIVREPIDFTVNRPEIIDAQWFQIDALPNNLHPVVQQALKTRKK